MGKELNKGVARDDRNRYEALKDKLKNEFILVELSWAGDSKGAVCQDPKRNV